jgi:hypothetical protein
MKPANPLDFSLTAPPIRGNFDRKAIDHRPVAGKQKSR